MSLILTLNSSPREIIFSLVLAARLLKSFSCLINLYLPILVFPVTYLYQVVSFYQKRQKKIYVEDFSGKVYDIEVQNDDAGADVHRARSHSSMLDTKMLKEKQKFKEIHDSYIIFITE